MWFDPLPGTQESRTDGLQNNLTSLSTRGLGCCTMPTLATSMIHAEENRTRRGWSTGVQLLISHDNLPSISAGASTSAFGIKNNIMTSITRSVMAVLVATLPLMGGCADLVRDHARAHSPDDPHALLVRCLQSSVGSRAVLGNGAAVRRETADRVLSLLLNEHQSFSFSTRSCLVAANGIIVQLCSSRTIIFRMGFRGRLDLCLFEFDADHRVLELHTTPDRYWVSTNKKLVDLIYAMDDLK